ETGLRLEIDDRLTKVRDYEVDAFIRLWPGNRTLAVEIKKWAQHANLGALIHQVKKLPVEGILAADYVNHQMAGKLRQEGVQFIDGAGNAYLNQPPVYVYVTGNRPNELRFTPTKEGAKRAFEP